MTKTGAIKILSQSRRLMAEIELYQQKMLKAKLGSPEFKLYREKLMAAKLHHGDMYVLRLAAVSKLLGD